MKNASRHVLVGPAGAWKMKRDFQIRFLKEMQLRPEHYLLDIGCGTLRGGIPIIDYLLDGHYFGIESRAHALDEGGKELTESGLEEKNPTLLLCPDISLLTIDRKFDYIWAFSVLMHMTDKILDDTLDFVSNHLSEDGIVYANVKVHDTGTERHWQGFPVVARPVESYRHVCARHGLVVSDLGPLKDHGHVLNVEFQDNQGMLRITKG